MNAIRNSVLGCFSHFEIALFQYREKANEAIGKHFDFAQCMGETETDTSTSLRAGERQNIRQKTAGRREMEKQNTIKINPAKKRGTQIARIKSMSKIKRLKQIEIRSQI